MRPAKPLVRSFELENSFESFRSPRDVQGSSSRSLPPAAEMLSVTEEDVTDRKSRVIRYRVHADDFRRVEERERERERESMGTACARIHQVSAAFC